MLITQMSWGESQQKSSLPLENEYGIDSEKNYSGKEVLELLDIIFEESDIAIQTSFDEGYKQGILFALPQKEYWKEKALQFEKQNKKEKIFSFISSFGLGILVGGATGFYTGIKF